MLIIFRAIRLNAGEDPYPENRNELGALNDITSRPEERRR